MRRLPFIDDSPNARVLIPLTQAKFDDWFTACDEKERTWIRSNGFTAKVGETCLIPTADGTVAAVAGIGDGTLWDWAAVAADLPAGDYKLDGPEVAETMLLGWAVAAYRFERYKSDSRIPARLLWPEYVDQPAVRRVVEAVYFVRDLVNTPAQDLGPAELADAVAELANRFDARLETIVGNDLLAKNYPAIHAIGRAAAREPCLIDLQWGALSHPKVTLVGKGVCFDTGGLNLKSDGAMRLMKKDMGGAAQVLGLAQMIMDVGLPIRLRVLIPAVENSIAGNALRPLDVVPTRKGLTVEIGHTDSEGRVILADALAEAASESPDLIIDIATLTGEARAALGTELPALFCDDDDFVSALLENGTRLDDPLWRMPLWRPYRSLLDSKVADICNHPSSSLAGATSAALFLSEFAGNDSLWVHIDLMAWNERARPGRAEGGEAQGIRAIFAALQARYGINN